MTKRERNHWAFCWWQALDIMRCHCIRTADDYNETPALIWATVHEHWNNPLQGHLIAASLLLDGAPIEALP